MAAYCFGYVWPGLEPEAVADRGGGSDEAGGEVRGVAFKGQRAERAQAAGQSLEVVQVDTGAQFLVQRLELGSDFLLGLAGDS